jgi:hypothetical protein
MTEKPDMCVEKLYIYRICVTVSPQKYRIFKLNSSQRNILRIKMGNTHSSFGVIFGSVIGGLVLAPFTAGASAVAVAIASASGVGVGATAFTINSLNNRDAPKNKEVSSLALGFVGGVLGPTIGMASAMGAEVAIGCEVAGTGIGLGVTNAGDIKLKPYIGNQQEAVKHYTQKEEKTRYQKEVEKERKKKEAERLNALVAKYTSPKYTSAKYTSPKYTSKKQTKPTTNKYTSHSTPRTSKGTYQFVPHRTNDPNTFKNMGFRLYNDDPVVERVYVIRRKLDTLPFYIGWMSHSGLLLKSSCGRWFICEYGTESDQNKVSLYEVTHSIKKSDFFSSFEHARRKWHKQICGSPIVASIHSVKE